MIQAKQSLSDSIAELLFQVEKPSRYLGNEVNAQRKDPASVEVQIAMIFPDLYDLGLGNLGVHILYAILNGLPWASCERVYAPGLDMEKLLRERDLPLFTLENKQPIREMDGIGITLQSELTFTNILNILDLGGIPLRYVDRSEDDPLIFAGGPSVFNPEPLAPFMDFFVIGDGEDVVVEIADTFRSVSGRRDRLLALEKLQGVYVPALYPFETLPDGQILPDPAAPKIRKRVVSDLNGATFPVDYIVPFTQQVHDRISLEVLRGCTQGCRFCQAGMVTRPVRERTLTEVDSLLQRTLDKTGYEEVSLVSLSTCDYSQVRQLVENSVNRARPQNVSVSLPSLRLDSFSVELADMVAETRRTGLTVAPEAASPRLRAVINKWIPDEDLLRMSSAAFERGWNRVKMYFMIGLPTERDDDILAIADLAGRAYQDAIKIHGGAKINLGVSTFVPKPFTPFQWAEQISIDETYRRQNLLGDAVRDAKGIKFGRHAPQETFLEGLISRSDRRAADLIELAWRKGARFDAWHEHLRFDLWREAVEELNFDVAFALRERSVDERLPWDHIDILVDKQWLKEDYARAKRLEHAQDCRHKRCHKCGVIDHERALCASMLRTSIAGRKPEAAWVSKPKEPTTALPPVQRIWFRIHRTEGARFLSHLEAMNAWIRTLRRAKVPLAYSNGFHPHPKVAFSSALPHNQASQAEYMDISVTHWVNVDELVERLMALVPAGFRVISGVEVARKAPSLMSLVDGGEYIVRLPHFTMEQAQQAVGAIVGAEEVVVQRRQKQKKRRGRWGGKPRKSHIDLNIRPMISRMVLLDEPVPTIEIRMVRVDGKGGKVREVIALLTSEPERCDVVRTETLTLREQRHQPISEVWQHFAPIRADETAQVS